MLNDPKLTNGRRVVKRPRILWKRYHRETHPLEKNVLFASSICLNILIIVCITCMYAGHKHEKKFCFTFFVKYLNIYAQHIISHYLFIFSVRSCMYVCVCVIIFIFLLSSKYKIFFCVTIRGLISDINW